MGYGRAILAGVALLAACGGGQSPPDDPYLADLRQRVRRLKPEVEREVGRRLRDVEVVVLPRQEIVEEATPTVRQALSRIENGPSGEDLESEARAAAEGVADSAIALVDRRARIVFPDPGEAGSLDRLLRRVLSELEPVPDPRELDLILLHELVHVHQARHLETPAFHASARSRADLLARKAVFEGHAEHVARRIASRIGLADLVAKRSARRDPQPEAMEFPEAERRIAVADGSFAYEQGAAFVDAIVERLGYDEAVRRIFRSPPTLAAVSRPEEYFAGNPPSRWGPVAEDARRWLARERGEASLEAIALPMVQETCGAAAPGFREGFALSANAQVRIIVLVAEDEASARDLHAAWTRGLARLHAGRVASGLFHEIALSKKPDDWVLHYDASEWSHRQNVLRAGNLVVEVSCHDDSALEQGAERLARRAARFLTEAAWREAWLGGGAALLGSADPGLRLGAISRRGRFAPDEDWEVRWLGRHCEARDGTRSEEERIAALVAAIEDPHPAVVARGLRALVGLGLWRIPWPLLRARLTHEEASVRRAAWHLVGTNIGTDDPAREAPPAEAFRLVARALDDGDAVVRRRAVDCLTELREEPGVAELFRKALRDGHVHVRQRALITLSVHRFRLPDLLPEIAALLSERPDVASEALGYLGAAAESALPRLREILMGEEGRTEAAVAIWRITGDARPFFALVAEAAARGEPRGLDEAAELGAAARPVVPHVAKALDHGNRWVRIAAAEALGKIGGPEAEAAVAARLGVEREPKVLEALREAREALDRP